MSVADHDTVDGIGVETSTGKVVLTVSDHLDWSEPQAHLLALQEKLNTYLRFVESGEIVEAYPDARGRDVVIDLVMRLRPDVTGQGFIEQVRGIIKGAGLELRDRVLDD